MFYTLSASRFGSSQNAPIPVHNNQQQPQHQDEDLHRDVFTHGTRIQPNLEGPIPQPRPNVTQILRDIIRDNRARARAQQAANPQDGLND